MSSQKNYSRVNPATPWTQRGAKFRKKLNIRGTSSSSSNFPLPQGEFSRVPSVASEKRRRASISGPPSRVNLNYASQLFRSPRPKNSANEVKNESVVEAKRVPRWRELADRASMHARSESGASSAKNALSGSKSNVGGRKKGYFKETVQLIKKFPGPPSNSSNFTVPPSLRNNASNSRSFSTSATSKISVPGRRATHKYKTKSKSESSYFSSVSELVTNEIANEIRNKVGKKVINLKRSNQLPQEDINEHFEQIKRNLKGNGNHSVNNHKVINNIVNEQLANYKKWLKQPEQKKLQRFGLGFEPKQRARYLQPSLTNFHQLQRNFKNIKNKNSNVLELQKLRNKVYLQKINEKTMSKAYTNQQAILKELNQMISNKGLEQAHGKKKKNPLTQIGGAVPGLGVVKARRVGAGQSSVERNLANRRKVGGPRRQPPVTSEKQNRVASLLANRKLKK